MKTKNISIKIIFQHYLTVIIFGIFLTCSFDLSAQRYHHSTGKNYSTSTSAYHSHSGYSNHSGSHRSNYNYGVPRDSHGRIKRSPKARYTFMKETGYSHGRKGYVIDHIVPLSKGGCDCPSNMQWQTIEDAKRKDKTERN